MRCSGRDATTGQNAHPKEDLRKRFPHGYRLTKLTAQLRRYCAVLANELDLLSSWWV